MPSSGSFTATYGGHPFTLQLNWNVASQDPVTNTSVISWALYTIKTGAFTPYRTDGAATWALNYVGSGNWGPYNFNGAVGQTILMASGSFTVTHAADGTYTFAPSFSANALSTITTASGSGSAALPTIPRATQPTVSPVSGNTGSTYTIDVSTAASSAFYHDFYYSLDGGSTYTSLFTNIPATTTTENWTPASSLLPNASSVTAIIRVDTRASSGGTILGTKTVNLPLTVPSTVVPTISAVSFVDSQVSSPDIPTLMGGSGRFVQGWSKLKPTGTATGASGSTITDDEITMVGQTTPSGTTFGLAVNSSGAVPYSAIATDSRGRTSVPFTGTCTVKAYNFPNLQTPTVARTSDAAGLIPDPAGTYLAVVPAASVSDLTFSGSQKNNLDYQIRTQPDTGGAWTTVTAWTSAAAITWTTKQILTGYSATLGWNIEISIRDVFGHNGFNTANTVQVLTVHVPTETVFMDMDQGKGLGLGKYRDQVTGLMLDVQGDTHVSGQIKQGGNNVVDASMAATTAAAGIAQLATDAEATAGTDASHAVTPHALNAVRILDRGRKNVCMNGNFRSNQRAIASGAAFGVDSYGPDRWRNIGRTNLAFNPAARTATTGWAILGSGAITQLTGLTIPSLAGVTTAARNTTTSTGTGMGIVWSGSQVSPYSTVVPGNVYVISGYIRSSVAQTCVINLNQYNSSGTLVGNIGVLTLTLVANTWLRFSTAYLVPATVTRMGWYSSSSTSVASGSTIDATATMIEAGGTLLPYFDGSFTGCSWASTANASNSYVGSAAPSAPTLTYTAAPQGQTVTLNSGARIGQFIEQANAPAGAYVLSWSGTLTGRAYNKGTLSSALPAFAASGSTWTIDGTDDVILEFTPSSGTGTIGLVQFELGSVPTAYEYIPVGEELMLCLRYYYRIAVPSVTTSVRVAQGFQAGTTTGEIFVNIPTSMRTQPNFEFSNLTWSDGLSGGVTISAVASYQGYFGGTMVAAAVSFSSFGAASRPGIIQVPVSTSAYLGLMADF